MQASKDKIDQLKAEAERYRSINQQNRDLRNDLRDVHLDLQKAQDHLTIAEKEAGALRSKVKSSNRDSLALQHDAEQLRSEVERLSVEAHDAILQSNAVQKQLKDTLKVKSIEDNLAADRIASTRRSSTNEMDHLRAQLQSELLRANSLEAQLREASNSPKHVTFNNQSATEETDATGTNLDMAKTGRVDSRTLGGGKKARRRKDTGYVMDEAHPRAVASSTDDASKDEELSARAAANDSSGRNSLDSTTPPLEVVPSLQLTLTLQLMHGVSSDRGPLSLLYEVANCAQDLCHAMHCIVFRTDKCGHMYSLDDDELVVEYNDGLMGHAAVSGKINNTCADELWDKATAADQERRSDNKSDSESNMWDLRAEHEHSFKLSSYEESLDGFLTVNSILCIPVVVAHQKGAFAVIELFNKIGDGGETVPFTDTDEWLMGHIADVIATTHAHGDTRGDLETIVEEGDDALLESFEGARGLGSTSDYSLHHQVGGGSGAPSKQPKLASAQGRRHWRRRVPNALVQVAKMDDFACTVFDKPEAVRRLLGNVIETNPIRCKFDGCSPLEKNKLIDAFEKQVVTANTVIIRQDDEGDYFYVLEDGVLVVEKTHKLIGMITKGNGFGELAIIHDSPRAATVRAQENATLWRLRRDMCTAIMMKVRLERSTKLHAILSGINIGGSQEATAQGAEVLSDLLNKDKIEHLVDQLEPEGFREGACIMRQGQPGDELYIVEEGEVSVWVADPAACRRGDRGEEVAVLGAGSVIGERALLSEDKRQATLFAKTDLKCLSLGRDDFTNAMGSIKELLGTNPATRRRSSAALATTPSSSTDRRNQDQDRFNLSLLNKVARLGAGTFGRVDMMQHATSQRVYAMKSLRKANIVEKNLQQRTLNEISILERMDHGFILRLFCTLQDVKCVHMVLELVQGGELFTHLEQQV